MAKWKLWESVRVSISLVRLSCVQYGVAADLEKNEHQKEKLRNTVAEDHSECNQDEGSQSI